MMVDVLTAIRERRSIRRYTSQPVAAEAVERLLTAATWAPSAHNRQPWRFAVVRAPDAKEHLASAMGHKLRADRLADGDAPALVEQDAARSYTRLTTAPVIIVACLTLTDMDAYPDVRRQNAEYLMAVQSVAMALQNLLLAAQVEGLGACWMCAPLFCQDVVRDSLRLPSDWEAQAMITLGYPANQGKKPTRQSLSEITLMR